MASKNQDIRGSVAQSKNEEINQRGEYTAPEVDTLCSKFEQCYRRLEANKDRPVKRNAAERDLFKAAEQVRDLLLRAQSGEKQKLEEVFGGACLRFHRLNNVKRKINLAKDQEEADESVGSNKEDPRWKQMADVMDAVREILESMGSFTPWVETDPPTKIGYGDEFPPWLADDAEVNFFPTVDGAEGVAPDPSTLYYEIDRPLPGGLVFDKKTGSITGTTAPDVEVPECEYKITCANIMGSAEVIVKFGIKADPPEELSYEVDESVMVGTAVDWGPIVTGGKIREWELDRDLPKGLFLDEQTGAIGGMPLKTTEDCEYTVTGSNAAGFVETTFTMEVMPAPPQKIIYKDMAGTDFNINQTLNIVPEVEMKGPKGETRKVTLARQGSILTTGAGARGLARQGSRMSVSSFNPSWGRGTSDSGAFQGTKWTRARNPQWEQQMAKGMETDVTFTVSPELPEGLILSKHTGVISGRPTATVSRKQYKIIASNDSGSTEANLVFGVVNLPPKALHYPDVPDVLHEGEPISFMPEVDGAVDTFSIEQELPSGLALDERLGAISGVPLGACAQQVYRVTASNEAGQAVTGVSFRVQREAPGRLLYYPNQLSYAWQMDMELTPQVFSKGGRSAGVENWTVEPELPKGLKLNAATGTISGKPSVVTAENGYVVTAKNESGMCEIVLGFEIKEMPPADLEYTGIDDEYFIGEQMSSAPVVVGGANAWQVSPDLPKGLKLDQTNGTISGTPTELSPEREYTIAASNNAGGTSVVVEFGVVAPEPKAIHYREIGSQLQVGRDINASPTVLPSPAGATFKVEPALPEGLKFDESTGAVSGSAKETREKSTYTVTAANDRGSVTCELNFECMEAPDDPLQVDQAWAAALMDVTDIANIGAEPDKKVRLADWMVWMVHRAWLDDPSLTIFDFSNLSVPFPQDEPRIFPKLMNAMGTNTQIKSLLLPNTNFRNPQAVTLGESLRKNTTLEVLCLDSNWIDADGMVAIAEGLSEHLEANVNTVKVSNQQAHSNYGRTTEEALTKMLEKNDKIVKLSFHFNDPHWNNQSARWQTRNGDRARQRRKAEKGVVDKPKVAPAIAKVLTKVVLDNPPDKAAWEIWEDDDEKSKLMRRFVGETKKLPTREQLQAFAKKHGLNLKFAEVAPLLKDFRTKLLESVKGTDITCWDDSNKSSKGNMKAFTEKNNNLNLDVFGSPTGHWDFGAKKEIGIETTEKFAEWIFNEDAPVAAPPE